MVGADDRRPQRRQRLGRGAVVVLGGERAQPRRRSVGQRRRDLGARLGDGLPARQLQQLRDGQRAEAHALRARPDRRQQPIGRAGAQHQVIARQRLLQRLQQAVGGVRVHRVGVLDDDDARRGLVRPRARQRQDRARVVDDDLTAGARRAERRHVRVEAGVDAPADLARAATGAGRRLAVERHRQPERGAALADAGRPIEQVGVRQMAALDRAQQGRARRVLADEVREPHPVRRT